MKNLTRITETALLLSAHLSMQKDRDERAVELTQTLIKQIAALSPSIQAQMFAGQPEHKPLRPNDVTDFDDPNRYQAGGVSNDLGLPPTQATMKRLYNQAHYFKTDIENLRAYNAMLVSEPYLEGPPPLRALTHDKKVCTLDTSKLGNQHRNTQARAAAHMAQQAQADTQPAQRTSSPEGNAPESTASTSQA